MSNITTQTCYLLCGHKKLDDSKKISILKKGNRDRSEKLWKQGRGQKARKQMREWKLVEDRAQDLLYLIQNSKAFAIPILTASVL